MDAPSITNIDCPNARPAPIHPLNELPMIKPFVSVLFVCAVATVQSLAQNDLVLAATKAPVVEIIQPPAIVERGPHHALVQWVSTVQDADGSSLTITNQYVNLATGLNFKNETGDWVTS